MFLAAVAGAAPAPERTIATALPVQDLALTGGSLAYVEDAPQATLRCARIGLWKPRSGRRFLFDSKEDCLDLASTGQGVWDLAVATDRLLWITYTGGNFREWMLWTATTTRRAPRRLRFVARDVDARSPIVLGPGTAEGIPYAVDRQVVYLGDDGKAIFKTTVGSPVRAIAAGYGGRVRVGALLDDGTVVGLDRTGRVSVTVDDYASTTVSALRVFGLGLAIQTGSPVTVHLAGADVRLPFGSGMVDLAQGRILWSRNGSLGTTAIGSGRSVRLFIGTTENPVHGQLEQRGFAWARGKLVHWRAGRLP